MHRLALAFLAALVIHVLLLMIVVPEPKVEHPEIIGSGEVTVSIIRSPSHGEDSGETAKQDEPEKPSDEVNEQDVVEEIEDIQPIGTEEVEPVVPAEKVLEEAPKVVRENLEPARTETVEQQGHVVDERNTDKSRKQEISEVFSETETLQNPEPIQDRNRPPKYPELARKRGWEGTVVLEVDIESDGSIKEIKLIQGSSYDLLDNEAMRAVRKWHFKPGRRAGKFVAMKVHVPVHFKLQE